MRAGRRSRSVTATICLALGSAAVLGPPAAGVTDGPGAPALPDTSQQRSTAGQIVVKLAPGAQIEEVNRRWGSTTRSALLASRSLYLVEVPPPPAKDAKDAKDAAKREKDWAKQAGKVAKAMQKDPSIIYAELNAETGITEGDRFHYWPSGGPSCGSDPALYTAQPAVTRLDLTAVHRTAGGAGRTIAVLDTGVDLDHPALAGRIAAGGYDYVDDDSVPDETPAGAGNGHGTFVAGISVLVAPRAKILPLRVLDADGRGDSFVVAEAIYDAVEAGADVINMSFGTADKVESKVLKEAVKEAAKRSVVIAAAGNDGSRAEHYPAAMSGVVSVAAEAATSPDLAPFSSHGKWVDLAAPGESIVSALPCGYGSWSGTSMAAPFVAGAAAVLAGARTGVASDKLVKALDEGSEKVKGMDVHSGAMNLRRSLDKLK